jgi:hypothetical protein
LLNFKIVDNDITKLAYITNLKVLNIANMFEVEQFAFLAAKLNTKLISKIQPFYESDIDCDKCNSKKVMITGKRKPFLCSKCEKNKINDFVHKFNDLIDKSASMR